MNCTIVGSLEHGETLADVLLHGGNIERGSVAPARASDLLAVALVGNADDHAASITSGCSYSAASTSAA